MRQQATLKTTLSYARASVFAGDSLPSASSFDRQARETRLTHTRTQTHVPPLRRVTVLAVVSLAPHVHHAVPVLQGRTLCHLPRSPWEGVVGLFVVCNFKRCVGLERVVCCRGNDALTHTHWFVARHTSVRCKHPHITRAVRCKHPHITHITHITHTTRVHMGAKKRVSTCICTQIAQNSERKKKNPH
jgi:hypothetical protein